MQKFIWIIVVCAFFLLSGCSNNVSDNIDNYSKTIDFSNQSKTEDESDYTSQSIENDKQETVEKFDSSIPDEFVDYRKFIGKDIAVLNVDTSVWDNNKFSHDLWDGSFYGHNGKISVRLGWDNKTIIDFFLILNNDEKINEDERSTLNEKVISIFGNNVKENNISYSFSGIGDYEFCIPKTLEQESVCTVSWNIDVLSDYINSKPKEPTTESSTTQEPIKQDPYIGMTVDEVKNSTWGKPSKINKTTTQYGIHEQWVYSSGRYIYFDNGIVTAIQE